jgi:hypothetical protein
LLLMGYQETVHKLIMHNMGKYRCTRDICQIVNGRV